MEVRWEVEATPEPEAGPGSNVVRISHGGFAVNICDSEPKMWKSAADCGSGAIVFDEVTIIIGARSIIFTCGGMEYTLPRVECVEVFHGIAADLHTIYPHVWAE